MEKIAVTLLAVGVLLATGAAPRGPEVYFVGLKDGSILPLHAKIKFGIRGMKLRPAGEDPEDKGSGHHHLIIDGGPIPEGTLVPADEKHIHFGKAQTETEVDLATGFHVLTLQLADGAHRSYGPRLAQSIQIIAR